MTLCSVKMFMNMVSSKAELSQSNTSFWIVICYASVCSMDWYRKPCNETAAKDKGAVVWSGLDSAGSGKGVSYALT
jgi:hypothetical protein